MNQKEVTYSTIISVLNNTGVNFTDGDDVKTVLNTNIKETIRTILFNEFRSGNVEISEDFKVTKLNNDSELKKYVASLVSNWIRKDTRLNGGNKHETKNPGSRAGQSDPQVRELRKLLKKVKGTDKEDRVKQALDTRITEVKASRVKADTINANLIPENLKELV